MAKGDSVAGLGDKVMSMVMGMIIIAIGLLIVFQVWSLGVEDNATANSKSIVTLFPLIGVVIIIIMLVLAIGKAVKDKW